jgi:hypothetical protein
LGNSGETSGNSIIAFQAENYSPFPFGNLININHSCLLQQKLRYEEHFIQGLITGIRRMKTFSSGQSK